MKVEQPFFRLWVDPDIPDAEWNEMGSTLCKIIVCGKPQSPKHRRAVAVRQCLAMYWGAPSSRAKQLAARYQTYIASSGWRLERDLEELPPPRSTEHLLLHRLGKVNAGRSLRWRRIYDIAEGLA